MLKVASYNIRKALGTDWQRRPDRILSVIAETGARIVALQEADRRAPPRPAALLPAAIERVTGLRAVGIGRQGPSLGWHGNTLLVGPEIAVTGVSVMDLPGLEPRGACAAILERPACPPIRVVGTHFGLLRASRRAQARALLRWLRAGRPIPTIVMGDLNEWGEAGCLTELGRGLHVLRPGPSWHAQRPVVGFDRIAVSEEWRVEAVGVHRSALAATASDHLPVWARLRLAD